MLPLLLAFGAVGSAAAQQPTGPAYGPPPPTVRDEQRIKAGLEDAKKKILAAADQEIAAATTHARRQLQQYAAELAIDQAAQKLVVTAETDRLLVQSFAARLAGEDPKSGEN